MSYRYDREKKRKRIGYLIATVILVTLFFTPFLTWVFDVIERPLARAWEQSQENLETTSNLFHRFYAKGKLIKENESLKQKINLLEVDVLRTHYLESTLETYQILQGRAQEGETVIPAEIIVREPLTPADTILINRGTTDGISAGDSVITSEHLFLGYVNQVFDTTARVHLATKEGITTQAILYPHEEALTLYGNGKSYRAQLSRESEVEVGDVVYQQAYPGRIIGIVREVSFDPRDPLKTIYLSAPVSLRDIQVVGVVQKNTQ